MDCLGGEPSTQPKAASVSNCRTVTIDCFHDRALQHLLERVSASKPIVISTRSSKLSSTMSSCASLHMPPSLSFLNRVAGSIYKQKYERALREAEMNKRQLSQLHEDDLEKQVMARKATEKRLSEALADLDEGRQAINQWKRKAQKLSAELQDLKLLVEEHMARNAELEKKQRKCVLVSLRFDW